MTPISPAQLAEARTLVAQRLDMIAKLHSVTMQMAPFKRRVETAQAQFFQRIKFDKHPENLAGLAELAQRNGPSNRRFLTLYYEWFLRDMIDPLLPMDIPQSMRRPHQVNFHTLPHGARPYLLGPYLNIHPGNRFPRLCLERSVPTEGILHIIQTGGPVDAAFWRAQLPTINAWLGRRWVITEVTGSSLSLFQRADLPKVIPMQRAYLRPSELFLGINTETHQPEHLPLSELTSGTFIVGAAGSGKSNATHLVMQSVLANLNLFQAVFCVDGKEGMTFARYRTAAPHKVRILTDEPDLWRLTSQLVAITRQRNATLARMGLDKAPNNFVAVIIEEMSTYTAKPATDDRATTKAHAQFIADLSTLARKGRSAGLKILITAQDPTQEQVPTAVRANCQTSIIFRLGIDQHATTVLGGEIPPGHDPRKLTTGRALIKRDTGTLMTVQFPIVPEPGGRA